MELSELQMRRRVCLFCLQTTSAIPADEPRRAAALEEYNRQLAEIDARIAAITGTPPETVIGLKAALLIPSVPNAKG